MSDENKSMQSEIAQELLQANLQNRDVSDKKVEETEEEKPVTTDTEEQSATSANQDQGIVITEELAQKFGVPKTMVGKPIDELAYAMRETHKNYTQSRQELSEIRKELDSLKQSEKKEIKQETGIDISKLPDPLEDSEGFNKALGEILGRLSGGANEDALVEKIVKKVAAMIEPDIKPAKDLAVKNTLNEVTKAIQNGLPKGEDAAQVMQLWADENKEMLEMYGKRGWSPYGENPSLMVKDILKFYKSNSYDELSKTQKDIIEKEVEARLKKRAEKGKTNIPVKNTTDRNETGGKKTGLISEIADDLKRNSGIN